MGILSFDVNQSVQSQRVGMKEKQLKVFLKRYKIYSFQKNAIVPQLGQDSILQKNVL
jgi:hypothetical protein